jgi:hypothetical protein
MANGRAQHRGLGYVLSEISGGAHSLDVTAGVKGRPKAKLGLQGGLLACERTLEDLNEPVTPSHLASPLPNYGRSSRESRM